MSHFGLPPSRDAIPFSTQLVAGHQPPTSITSATRRWHQVTTARRRLPPTTMDAILLLNCSWFVLFSSPFHLLSRFLVWGLILLLYFVKFCCKMKICDAFNTSSSRVYGLTQYSSPSWARNSRAHFDSWLSTNTSCFLEFNSSNKIVWWF